MGGTWLRVARCARRVVVTTGKLIETATEPLIGKRFLPAADVLSRVICGGGLGGVRPFVPPAQFVAREGYRLVRSSGRFLKSLFRRGRPLERSPAAFRCGRD